MGLQVRKGRGKGTRSLISLSAESGRVVPESEAVQKGREEILGTGSRGKKLGQ